ncbi:DUF3307 domain-containing protein [Planomonospora sp. ID82291]|nr:DUF3307 domain-containing protein [Planomonospora sp. ID82291]
MIGDYIFQSDWMASHKTERWWPAIAHGATYMVPFLVLTRSPEALLVIGGTHIVLDHYRAAKYVIWLKNQLGPAASRPTWKEAASNHGFPASVPGGLAFAMLIVVDNTIHLLINTAALTWLV